MIPPRLRARLAAATPLRVTGRVVRAVGLEVQAAGLAAPLGAICRLRPPDGATGLLAEVVGFRDERLILLPLGDLRGIGPGWRVEATGQPLRVPVGDALLGRVLDGLGQPIDGLGPVAGAAPVPVAAAPPPPLARQPVRAPLPTGLRVIDGLLTCGRGQRGGIFAGSGVGKSTLLGMLVRSVAAEVVVVALIGERGREVRETLEHHLGEAGRRKAVVVVATADQPALVRTRAAWVASTIAAHFRAQGRAVALFVDSLTRWAMAQREVGLATGEPPTTRGYPPSVWSLLPQLLEQAGTAETGSVTGFYTVLVEGDDLADPVSDAARSILDGHLVLARELAARGHYPAIDVLESVSRVMPLVADPAHQAAAAQVRRLLALGREARELVQLGAYQAGAHPDWDRALALWPRLEAFLCQRTDEASPWAATLEALAALAAAEREGQP